MENEPAEERAPIPVDRLFDVHIKWAGSEKLVQDVTGYSVEEGNLFLSGQHLGSQWIECIPLKHVLEYRMDEVS